MLRMVQLLGEPATGKTTLMRKFIATLSTPDGEVRNNIGPDGRHFNFVYGNRYPAEHVIVMGKYDGAKNDGTDRFGLNTQPPMLKLLQDLANDPDYAKWCVVLEGDRFANPSFLIASWEICHTIHILLEVDELLLPARHAERGDTQGEVWLAGRRKKIASLACMPRVVTLRNDTPSMMGYNLSILKQSTFAFPAQAKVVE